MVQSLQKAILTLIVTALVGWLILHGIAQKQADNRLVFDKSASHMWDKKIMASAKMLHRKGMIAYTLANYRNAETLFKKAVAKDIFHMESWLRLAETQLMLGDVKNARNILLFSIDCTQSVMRWKWRQMLLARDLGMEQQFVGLANQLLRHRKTRKNANQLLQNHYQDNASKVLAVLSTDNKIEYLLWLIRWNRLEDSMQAWDAVVQAGLPDNEVSLQYLQYLLRHKEVAKASAIWRFTLGNEGITNGGFEDETLQKAFGWRYRKIERVKWRVQRTSREVRSGNSSLKLEFFGKENLSFNHISQIVPLEPGRKYRLTYAWKSRDMTTDQKPFVDVSGFGCKGLYSKGEMAEGAQPWREGQIEMEVPVECQAATVRIRRLPSKRIDSKIAGTLWLDDFRLTPIPNL